MAAMVLKTMFVHVVLNYDVRFGNGVGWFQGPAEPER